jgi:hypothetical protein
MSRRTAEANKAVAAAWINESQLILERKGTRDWTPEQQRDILEKGKAYDENGKALEGHHMKSVEAYPEFQGDAGNIQLLSRDEHILAHDGSTRNPTNGYYDPITGETKPFGECPYEPFRVINLSDPIAEIKVISAIQSDDDLSQKVEVRDKFEGIKNSDLDFTCQPVKSLEAACKQTIDRPKAKKRQGVINSLRESNVVRDIGRIVRHPVTQTIGRVAWQFVAPILLNAAINKLTNNSGGKQSTNSTTTNNYEKTNLDVSSLPPKSDSDRLSSSPHMVNTNGQTYHTKDGPIWKPVAPYKRPKE